MTTNRRYGRLQGVQESWNSTDGKPSNHPGKACSPRDGGEYIGARNYMYGSVQMKVCKNILLTRVYTIKAII